MVEQCWHPKVHNCYALLRLRRVCPILPLFLLGPFSRLVAVPRAARHKKTGLRKCLRMFSVTPYSDGQCCAWTLSFLAHCKPYPRTPAGKRGTSDVVLHLSISKKSLPSCCSEPPCRTTSSYFLPWRRLLVVVESLPRQDGGLGESYPLSSKLHRLGNAVAGNKGPSRLFGRHRCLASLGIS